MSLIDRSSTGSRNADAPPPPHRTLPSNVTNSEAHSGHSVTEDQSPSDTPPSYEEAVNRQPGPANPSSPSSSSNTARNSNNADERRTSHYSNGRVTLINNWGTNNTGFQADAIHGSNLSLHWGGSSASNTSSTDMAELAKLANTFAVDEQGGTRAGVITGGNRTFTWGGPPARKDASTNSAGSADSNQSYADNGHGGSQTDENADGGRASDPGESLISHTTSTTRNHSANNTGIQIGSSSGGNTFEFGGSSRSARTFTDDDLSSLQTGEITDHRRTSNSGGSPADHTTRTFPANNTGIQIRSISGGTYDITSDGTVVQR